MRGIMKSERFENGACDLSRRNILAWALKAALFAVSLSGGLVTKAWGKAKRFLVPRDANRRTLISRNPAEIDASQLDVTPLANFQTMGLSNFEIDVDKWRLVIKGDVEEAVSLTYQDILDLPAIERKVFMICPGFFTNQGLWRGVSVKSLMSKGRAKEGVNQIDFRGPETRYAKTHSVPIEEVLSDQVFLAYELNGVKLPEKHGFPLRLVAEDYYGTDWVKYVTELRMRTVKKSS